MDDTIELISNPDTLIISVTVPMKEVEPETDDDLEEGAEGESSEESSLESATGDSKEESSDNSGDQ